MLLSKAIKTLRIREGWTQLELALRVGVTPKMISFYELGQRNPSAYALKKLSKVFGVPLDKVVNEDETKKRQPMQHSELTSNIAKILVILEVVEGDEDITQEEYDKWLKYMRVQVTAYRKLEKSRHLGTNGAVSLSVAIKTLRLREGWTQRELARRIGIKPRLISFYETGQRTPLVGTLLKLSEAFGVSTNRLVNKGETKRQPMQHSELTRDTVKVLIAIGAVGEESITQNEYDEWLWFMRVQSIAYRELKK